MNFSTLDFAIFGVLVVAVVVVSFVGARWRGAKMSDIAEWSVGGHRFGGVIVWFLMGGDIYTAFALVSIPGGAFGTGGLIMYAAVYGIIAYPFLYFVMPRLYLIAKRHKMITGGDYVKARFSSPTLALLVALTGILAMLPYIALQIVGIRYVLDAMNLPVVESFIIAFLVVAAFTIVAGLRGPTLGAIIKGFLLWGVIIVATVVLASKFSGFGATFSSLPPAKYLIPNNLMLAFVTLGLGNGIAWPLFPNLLIGMFGAKDARTIKRNCVFLPVYQIWLVVLAVFGFVALAQNLVPSGVSSLAFPNVLAAYFPPTFVAIAFAGVIIGSMVPASLQSLAAANLITRNIYLEYFNKSASEGSQVKVGRVFVFVMIAGSLIFALTPAASGLIFYLLTMSYAWLLQTLPAVVISLFWKRLDKFSVGLGWGVGMCITTYGLYTVNFATSLLPWVGNMYVGVFALLVNLVVMVVVRSLVVSRKVKTESELKDDEYVDA